MSYTSWTYYAMIVLLLPVYYLLPKKFRWLVLLAGSMLFYTAILSHPLQAVILILTIVISYLFGAVIGKKAHAKNTVVRRSLLGAGILLSALPLLIWRGILFLSPDKQSLIIPVGISFYTLQIISYLTDIHKGKIKAERNPLKYALFISFFPQIIQGPIPRYEQLSKELFAGHDLKEENLIGGMQLIVWGFFLKLMIADRAALYVNTVFASYNEHTGLYILLAGILYSLQLYADFLSCTVLAKGVSQLFGIRLAENFDHPYFADSVRAFWRRWHISLSSWLRDYIYIPLGGSRSGKARRYLNILAVFLVSGLWHGAGMKYIVWGMIHGVSQIVEALCEPGGKKILPGFLRRILTLIIVMLGWIIFRADTLKDSIQMIGLLFAGILRDPLQTSVLFSLGRNRREFIVLILSALGLWLISFLQEKGIRIRAWINARNIAVRWGICLFCIWLIWICGAYGNGFNTADFIYGGF